MDAKQQVRDRDRVVFTMRLPDDLHQALKQCAVEDDRTVAWTIRAALKPSLAERVAS
jgi:predicted transcriptional regulator